MSRAGLALLVLLLAAPLLADEETRFIERANKTANAVADSHANLARWCFKQGLNVAGRDQLEMALALVPEHEKSMKELGYKRKKVEGVETWVLDEALAPPRVDGDAVATAFETLTRERDKLYAEAAVEYVKLARQAEKQELPAHAKVSYEQAVKYDPTNEDALTGAGWVKDDIGDWISPNERRERDENAAALSDAPAAEPIEELPDWTARAFKQAAALGVKSGPITVIGSGTSLSEAAKFAHAASSLSALLLGGQVSSLRVVLAADTKEHEDYCQTRHPGIPGLVDARWVIGEKEVEALLDKTDDKLGLERVVYAVVIFEVRRRCGETTHPWFEVGFASNLTRRLLGRVTTAEFSAVAAGPGESGRWKRTLRNLVAARTQPELDKLVVTRDPDENQVILAHFFVRYLCAERRAALADFCAAFKSAETIEDALNAAFEQDSGALNKLFLDWFARN
jgi:tetratricopeptide (TPR) repeat protein